MKKHYLILLVIASITLISGTLDLGNLFNYANQSTPNFASRRDNSPRNNRISDQGATLGRVLFYDKALSINDKVSCASCHKQEFAFGDNEVTSTRFDDGKTNRHSMRLVNFKHTQERKGFWDERAANLETLALMPIQSNEMGFEGTTADNTLDALVGKLSTMNRYKALFKLAYGDENVTQNRIAESLSQFIRSIQSFDSKYDRGRAQAGNNDFRSFPNFTGEENLGKSLFFGRARCQTCHRAPLFDIDPNSRNNGVIGVAGDPSAVDTRVTKSPTLRDLFNPSGSLNGPMMHDGSLATMPEVIAHYNRVPVSRRNNNLDFRLRGFNFLSAFNLFGGDSVGQTLNLRENEQRALGAFLSTLTGSAIYTDEKWSNPFDEDGTLTIPGVEADGTPAAEEEVPVAEEEVPVAEEEVPVEELSLCDRITIGSNGLSEMVIETPAVFFKTIQIRNSSRRTVFRCFNDCNDLAVIPNLPAGEYNVVIRLYDNTFAVLCDINERVEMAGNLVETGTTNVSARIATTSAINTSTQAVDKGSYQVYPNPAQHEVFVDLKAYAGQKGSLRLINQLGQTIQSFDYDELPSDRIRLDIDKAENGLHFLNILLDDKEMVTERVMVNKF